MPKKRKHHKSRTGCLQCRLRRVKCDEGAPCSHCARRREACSLGSRDAWQHGSTTSPAETARNLDTGAEPSHQSSELTSSSSVSWSQDLYLMHHWSTHTLQTLDQEDEQVRAVWSGHVMQLARKHSFLMHTLLSAAAAHLCGLEDSANSSCAEGNGSGRWSAAMLQHQNMALPLYRAEMAQCTADNVGALFAASVLMALMALFKFGHVSRRARNHTSDPDSADAEVADDDDDDDDGATAFDDMLTLFVYPRGVLASFSQHWHLIHSTPLIHLLKTSSLMHYHLIDLPPTLQQAMDDLEQTITSLCFPNPTSSSTTSASSSTRAAPSRAPPSPALPTLLAAHTALTNIYKDIHFFATANGLNGNIAFKWLVWTSSPFHTLVARRNPAALALLAHFFVLLALPEPRWYKAGVALRGLRALRYGLCLRGDGEGLLRWPVAQMAGGFAAFGVGAWEARRRGVGAHGADDPEGASIVDGGGQVMLDGLSLNVPDVYVESENLLGAVLGMESAV